jgi:hypothetical protein
VHLTLGPSPPERDDCMYAVLLGLFGFLFLNIYGLYTEERMFTEFNENLTLGPSPPERDDYV